MRMARRMALLCAKRAIVPPTFTNGTSEFETIGNYHYLRMLTSGTLTINDNAEYDLFVVGGGGGSERAGAGAPLGGAGGGYTATVLNKSLTANSSYTVLIGAGGTGGKYNTATDGGTTSIGSLISANGGKENNGYDGGNGGSGGGGSGYDWSDDNWSKAGGDGGSNGSNGESSVSGDGGTGQGTTTKAFGETNGTLYAGGGGGSTESGYSNGLGGDGGGGDAGYNGAAGDANSGGGAGGCGGGTGAYGGSGIAIIRWKVA